ncbi:hypothetical protein AB0O20_06670 [Streptomyces kronopolitis]|uniref:hypothetical protein n=1 Tax=Streptomyces kronopolitis TaxID=1612435 RepID=UPI00343C75EA
MTATSYPVIRRNGGCGVETHRPFAATATALRRPLRAEGWYRRSSGRDICPDCWKAGRR